MEPELDAWSTIEYSNLINNLDLQLVVTEHLMETIPPNLKHCASTLKPNHWPKTQQDRVLLLDPASNHELKPEDKNNFDYLLFGGILGDDPPQGNLL
jgi:ribosome biogenesis SPOUT family RNA methylase Rps3